MLFSNRVLKVGTVSVDPDNKVVIDIGQQSESEPDLSVSDASSDKIRDSKDKAEKIEAKAKGILQQANQQAEQIIADARVSAAAEQASIVEMAEGEASRIKIEAKEQAYQEGIEIATREGNAIRAEAQKVLESAEAERKQMQENLEPELVQLVVDIVDKLLGNVVQLNPAVIINLIKQGLSSATITGDVIVYVSSQDFDKAIEKKDEILALTDGSVKLDIVKDLSLSPMDCVIETPFGNIDASLGQQYEALKENLVYILNNR